MREGGTDAKLNFDPHSLKNIRTVLLPGGWRIRWSKKEHQLSVWKRGGRGGCVYELGGEDTGVLVGLRGAMSNMAAEKAEHHSLVTHRQHPSQRQVPAQNRSPGLGGWFPRWCKLQGNSTELTLCDRVERSRPHCQSRSTAGGTLLHPTATVAIVLCSPQSGFSCAKHINLMELGGNWRTKSTWLLLIFKINSTSNP